jgi:hypothetical protein
MLFTKIDKKNVIKNKVSLEDSINYIYSSGDEDGFDHRNREIFEIDQSGTYGSIPVSGINSSRIRYVDESIISNSKLHKGKLYLASSACEVLSPYDNVNNVFSEPDSEDVNLIIDSDSLESFFNEEELEDITSILYKVSNDKNKNYRFKIDRIKKNFLARDLNLEKINSVKRIQDYYNKRYSKKNNYKNFREGFSNYNCLNFFTIGNVSKQGSINSNEYIGSKDSKTHKNCLIYPNIYKNEKNQYDFNNLKEKSFCFYVNLNKQNKVKSDRSILSYNSGTILFIPGVISINIIKGSNTDGNGMTSMFRLCCQFGEYSYNDLNYADFTANSSYSLDASNKLETIISSDNILKYNNWHSVNVSLKNLLEDYYNVELFVDGKLIDSFTQRINFSNINENSYIMIGNKPKFLSNSNFSISDLNNNIMYNYFSVNSTVENDRQGAYCKKHISFGNDIIEEDLITSLPDSDFLDRVYFKDSLYTESSSFESFAFHGELHDIRIYNCSLTEESSIEIFKSSVKESEDIILGDLSFYVPVFYSSTLVKKEGLINLYNNTDKSNITYDYCTNPYYFNFCGGHELSIEHFVREFIKDVSPNVLFDEEENIELNFLSSEEIKNCSQKGEDPVTGVLKKIYNGNEVFSFGKSLTYRNNFILPNDNGIQVQNFNFIYNQLNTLSLESNCFKKNDFVFDYSFVRTDFYLNSNLYDSDFFVETFNNQNLEVNEDNQRVVFLDDIFIYKTKNLEERSVNNFIQTAEDSEITDFLDSYLPSDSFKKRNDLLWNISNRNFHSPYYSNDTLSIGGYSDSSTGVFEYLKNNYMTYSFKLDTAENESIHSSVNNALIANPSLISNSEARTSILTKIIYNTQNAFLNVGVNQKYNTYSNPCSRLIDKSFVKHTDSNRLLSTKLLSNSQQINYYSYDLPLYSTDYDSSGFHAILFSISSQFINKGIEKESFFARDVDLFGSGGSLNISMRDNNFGQIYRSDCLTKKATWNTIGGILYSEGFVLINHPGLNNFGYSNFNIKFNSSTTLYTHEINLPAYSGKFNVSSNTSYIEDLRIDNSAFNSDEDFVYITDINIHDENLNILAKARLANPFAKKNSDNVLFRLSMDY